MASNRRLIDITLIRVTVSVREQEDDEPIDVPGAELDELPELARAELELWAERGAA